jgi:hypothetical protein
MVSDSDGKSFPFYGNKNEVTLIEGPKPSYTTHLVTMNDNFYPHVTWDLPISSHRFVRLTKIKRNQKFLTWLVAMDVLQGYFIVLKTFKWSMKLEIDVDPSKEQGHRATLVNGHEQKQPLELNKNVKIPSCALYPSNANGCQNLIWRSYDDMSHPLAVVSTKSATQN